MELIFKKIIHVKIETINATDYYRNKYEELSKVIHSPNRNFIIIIYNFFSHKFSTTKICISFFASIKNWHDSLFIFSSPTTL